MELTTPIIIPKSQVDINYNSKLMFAGSCFAENISQIFINNKFQCLVNPSGIVYNPLSLSKMIDNLLADKVYTENDFFHDGTLYNSYDFHGSFSRADLQAAIESANNSITRAVRYLKDCDVFFITLGTAFVYQLQDSGEVVSNCHKQKASLFSRRLVSIDEITEALSSVIERVTMLNPKIRFVFTVSPIRHIRDGFHENTLSKSTLHLAVGNIVSRFGNCEYFPSYEIVMDELRDYRFYAEDMVHVSALAERIIWQRLTETYMSKNVQQQIRRVEKFMQSVNHRIQNPESNETAAFCQKNLSQAFVLEDDIQGLDLSEEKKYFKSFIKIC